MNTLDCGHAVTPSGIEVFGTGFAVSKDTGKRYCYPCADDLQREALLTEQRWSGYLSSNERRVTTWTGGTLGTVTRCTRNSRQTFIRMTDVHGQHWAGIGPAESGTYVSLRRVR